MCVCVCMYCLSVCLPNPSFHGVVSISQMLEVTGCIGYQARIIGLKKVNDIIKIGFTTGTTGRGCVGDGGTVKVM